MADLQVIQDKIYEIRGLRVMLDRDLAEMYGVTTSALNQSVKRNAQRFPEEFMFRISKTEWENMSSQFVTTSRTKRPKTSFPYAFTEQGVGMLSSVLRTPIAIQVCISVVKAFVAMRTYLTTTTSETLAARLESIDRRLLELEQTRIAGELGPVRESVLPEHLSAEVRIVDYSARAVVIFTDNRQDRRLLKWLGARYNGWLTWNGERVAGWVYPKSCIAKLDKYLPTRRPAL